MVFPGEARALGIGEIVRQRADGGTERLAQDPVDELEARRALLFRPAEAAVDLRKVLAWIGEAEEPEQALDRILLLVLERGPQEIVPGRLPLRVGLEPAYQGDARVEGAEGAA